MDHLTGETIGQRAELIESVSEDEVPICVCARACTWCTCQYASVSVSDLLPHPNLFGHCMLVGGHNLSTREPMVCVGSCISVRALTL